MEELFKNPLLGQSGDFGAKDEGVYFDAPSDIQNLPNPLAINLNGYDIKDSPFAGNPLKDNGLAQPENVSLNESKETEVSKKRLNDLDFNILQDSAVKKAQEEFSGNNILGKILYRYFPEIYKGFLIKKALKKLKSLNQTASDLVSKKIPYGESDERYAALSGYIKNANAIHAKLMKKI